MKKTLWLIAMWFICIWVSFGATFKLPNNDSSKVRTAPKLTGTGYMSALNSVKLSKLPTNPTTATLTTTLAAKGKTKLNYKKNTYTITVGYTSCKVNDFVNRVDLPKTITVDLTKVDCINKKKPVNFLPLIMSGQKMNIFFAKINWITTGTTVVIK